MTNPTPDPLFALPPEAALMAARLAGPIFIFGAGGFVGLNLLNSLLQYRDDVFGLSQDPKNNWRFIALPSAPEHLLACDITQPEEVRALLNQHRPRTIFNLAAYGAYSKQREYRKIYRTNFMATVDLLEALRENGYTAFIHAGSSSEYGINSAAPDEGGELIPNSHYAVSKTAVSSVLTYYGRIERQPVINLRLYSAYGPWEEPDRLVPALVAQARHGKLPPFVNPEISRDFTYVTDIAAAFVHAAARMTPALHGCAFNIGTGTKTTIRQISDLACRQFGLTIRPQFGEMPDRRWDVADWYANNRRARELLGWAPTVDLAEGLRRVARWQEQAGFDQAFWNWTREPRS